MDNKISVVMAVYKNDKAPWVRESIDSIMAQTLKADEIIVVVDGPIPTDIEDVLSSYSDSIKVIRVKDNTGLWNALNVGIAAARNELIARMDSDDIALPDRLALQVEEFRKDRTLSLVGGQVSEFYQDASSIIGQRSVPQEHVDIVKFSKRRSPFNHPTVMYDKTAILAVGGYRQLRRSEDYDLWMRLLDAGYKTRNLSSSVLLFRVDNNGIARRTAWGTAREQISTRGSLYREGYIGFGDLAVVSIGYILACLAPVGVTRYLYRRLLRD